MNAENYVVMQGWMITELGLTGKELVIYALIYGFSQGEGGGFSGGLKYMAEWAGSTKRTVMAVLQSLETKGVITKYEEPRNGIRFCRYVANFTTGEKISPGSEKISPKEEKERGNTLQKENTLKSVQEKVPLTASLSPALAEAVNDFREMRNAIKLPMTDRALKRLLNKLNELSDNDDGKIAILEQSILNCWKDIYPIHEDGKQQRQPKQPPHKETIEERIARMEREGTLGKT